MTETEKDKPHTSIVYTAIGCLKHGLIYSKFRGRNEL